MKINRIIQSILLAIVVVGLFAAMAKNEYGFTLIGGACFGLSLLYVVQVIWKLIEDYSSMAKNDFLSLAELFLLSMMLSLFGLRAFYIYVPYAEFIFGAICVLLMVVYLIIAGEISGKAKRESIELAWSVRSLYFALLFFLGSMLTRTFSSWPVIFGSLAFLISIPFVVSIVRRKQFEYSGKTISLFRFIKSSKNKSGLLFIFFISSAIYTGLSQYNLIPEIENSARPKAYIELIDDAESGKEKAIDGKYRHEEYKAVMDKFLNRHANSK